MTGVKRILTKCLECGKEEPMSIFTIKNSALCYDCKQRQKQKLSSEKYRANKPVKMCNNNCGKQAPDRRRYCEECKELIKSEKKKS
jgi:hypothetical protein